MKKKLKLEQIKVESFVTIDSTEKNKVMGGMQPAQSYNIPCSDFARCTPDITDIALCNTLPVLC